MSPKSNQNSGSLEERLKEYRELLSQFEMVRDRLRRADEERGSVPRRVYEKVRTEYDRQLDALRAKMTPLREEIETYRVRYEEKLQEASDALELIEEEMAELTFRHRIGEFGEQEATTQRQGIETRLEESMARINSLRETMAAMDAVALSEAPPARTTTVAPPEPAPAAPWAPGHHSQAEAASDRRPVIRTSRSSESASAFENPHDWIDEFGRDLKRQESALETETPAADESDKPSPVMPVSTPSLVFVSGPHAGQSIPLLQTTLTIGREHDNNIEIKDADVARYHARILNERGRYVVEDMSSTTGTWVNGERKQRATLGQGDVIRIGQTEIAVDFEWASNPLERTGIDPTT